MGLLDFFWGNCAFSTLKKNAAKLVNLCMKNEIEYKNPTFDGDRFVFECNIKSAKKLESACDKRAIELVSIRRRGLPELIRKYKARAGLPVGAIIAFILVVFSLNTVWRIDFSGNVNVSSSKIEKLLHESGFYVGSYIPSADLTHIENSVMQSCSDIAWISINLNGVVAKVEIRENNVGALPSKAPAELVAVKDGKIERVEVYNGNCLVKPGDIVRAGDVLVSGIYQKDGSEIRLTRAMGNVFARTVRELCIEIPFENTKKVYTGRVFNEFYVNFFKNSIKVFANTGNLHTTCDIIYENGKMGLAGFPRIPIGYSRTQYVEYGYKQVRLDENEAMNKAFDALDSELKKLSSEIELVNKNIDFEITETAYILKCRIVCIENIAQTKEIE